MKLVVALTVFVAMCFVLTAVASGAQLRSATVAVPVVLKSITVGTSPGYNHYDALRGETYVSNFASNNVSVINDTTLTVVASVAVGTAPKGIDYYPPTNTIWVADSGGTANVEVINDSTHSVIHTITPVAGATRPENDPSSHEMWVTSNISAGVVLRFNATTYASNGSIRVGTDPVGIDKELVDNVMLVSNYGSANVTVLNLTTGAKVATIAVGTQPEAIQCLDALNECFVANRNTGLGGSVSVISDKTWTVVATVTVGRGPIGLSADDATNEVYVTNALDGTVSVINALTNSVASLLTVGTQPHGITAIDPVRGYVFASNQGSNNVSVIIDG